MKDTTICIPVFNGASGLRGLFNNLLCQTIDFQFDIIFLDSGSTDGSDTLIEEFADHPNVTALIMDNDDFGHGKTRNQLVNMVETEYVLFMTQDCLPTSNDWLQKMHDSLSSCDDLIAAFCRHKPWETSHPVRMRYITKTFDDYLKEIQSMDSYINANGVHYFCDNKDITSWDRITAFSNVSAIYRSDQLRTIGFEDVDFAEDRRFMKTAIEQGHCIGYLDDVSVCHSHDYGYLGTLKRSVDEWKAISEHGHFPYKFQLWHIVTQSIVGYLRDLQFVIFEGKEIPFLKRFTSLFTCLIMEIMIKTGMYIGLNHTRFSDEFLRKMSYQSNWRDDRVK